MKHEKAPEPEKAASRSRAKVHQLSERRALQAGSKSLPEAALFTELRPTGLIQASKTAVELLERAQERSAEILEAAQEEAREIRAEAYKQAYSEAKEEVLRQNYSLACQEAELVASAQKRLSEICRRVCTEALCHLPEAVFASISERVKEGVNEFLPSPMSLTLAKPQALSEELQSYLRHHNISLREEPSLARDEFLLETSAGSIHCSVSAHLNSLLEIIQEQAAVAFPAHTLCAQKPKEVTQ